MRSARSRHRAVIRDALAQVLVRGVIREPAELVLHGLRQARVLHDRVLRGLARELLVEVRDVEHGFLRVRDGDRGRGQTEGEEGGGRQRCESERERGGGYAPR